MKTERLLEIVFYLLNHKGASSQELAKYFSVSSRTIKRDIEALSLAGIPVFATSGRNGGYEILDSFKLARPLTNSDDYSAVIRALKSLNSALNDANLEKTLNKFLAIENKKPSTPLVVDFDIVKENADLADLLELLKTSITSKNEITFYYHGQENLRKAEPLALNYRWYAWYLLAFDCEKKDFRIFKLVRMSQVSRLNEHFNREIENLDEFIEKEWAKDRRETMNVRLGCQAEVWPDVREYFRPKILERKDNGDFICEFTAVKSERLWFSLLMGFGDKVKVLSPILLAQSVQESAQKIISQYTNKE